MTKEEITNLLEVTQVNDKIKPSLIRVMCTKDITHYGYFVSGDDYAELKEKNLFRFVLRNNYRVFNKEYIKTGKYNTNYSITLTGEEVLYIEFVMPLTTSIF
jgi:hypothetical protein